MSLHLKSFESLVGLDRYRPVLPKPPVGLVWRLVAHLSLEMKLTQQRFPLIVEPLYEYLLAQ